MPTDKPIVFVITPFSDEFLSLYEHLKTVFNDKYEFTNAKDLDNQENILQDIVQGIHKANVIIADLTGLNANVFYELGLAHAMNKKVIIITQAIGELPFDIQSYRANEYSLLFNKIPELVTKLEKLLAGAIDNTITYGNPVSDYLPDFYNRIETNSDTKFVVSEEISNGEDDIEEEKGYLDYITDIEEYTDKMTIEINSMSQEMQEVNSATSSATSEINRVKSQSGNASATFIRNICRKLSEPTALFAIQIKGHTLEISKNWSIIENSYLSLLDSKYAQNPQNIDDIKKSMSGLVGMQTELDNSSNKIENFTTVLQTCMGIERKLNKALTSLVSELESYLLFADTMSASIDRITNKGKIVVEKLSKE